MREGFSFYFSIGAVFLFASGCTGNKQFFENQGFEKVTQSAKGQTEPDAGTVGPEVPGVEPSIKPENNSTTSSDGKDSPPVSVKPSETGTTLAKEMFSAAHSPIKKIDFLFVVDNSRSMTDNQAKLAAGFEVFAQEFYRRNDLDICTAIITSDRYLGKVGPNGYQRERFVACTNPEARKGFTPEENEAFIGKIIADFKAKMKVGISGSAAELVGKSLVTFLYNEDNWKNVVTGESKRTEKTLSSFFRKDAVANISFLTDENNWKLSGVSTEVVDESMNDIPAIATAADSRKGVKTYLDEFFSKLNLGQGSSYSIAALTELSRTGEGIPSRAMNIDPLSSLIGRESAMTDIQGNAESYASLYNSVAKNLVLRANAFHLNNNLSEPDYPNRIRNLKVSLVSALSGQARELVLGTDYEVLLPNGIVLNSRVSEATQANDMLQVEYRYLSQ